MLIRGNSVVNHPVISVESGKKLEKVKDLVYDARNNQLKALLIDEGGWFSDAKVIPFENVDSIGRDAVMIKSEKMIRKASEFANGLSHVGDNDKYLTKTKIVTENGNELGKVSDLLFDDRTGKVEELEVSQGLRNIQSGKKYVKISDIVTIGRDATVVRSFAEDSFQEQAQRQGIQGAINKGRQGAANTLKQAKEKGKQTIYSARDAVKNPDTQREIENAKAGGRQMAAKFRGHVNSGQAHSAISDVKTGATDLIDKAKEKAQEMQDKVTEEKKKDAVGKYLNVNILSPDDEVIAERGEMVTNEMIDKAENFGLLNKVINNVSSSP